MSPKLAMPAGLARLFRIPNPASLEFRPGAQPLNPGESHINPGFPYFSPIPWPNGVPSLVALANNPGIARARALQIQNNATAPQPNNYLFLSGVAQKS